MAAATSAMPVAAMPRSLKSRAAWSSAASRLDARLAAMAGRAFAVFVRLLAGLATASLLPSSNVAQHTPTSNKLTSVIWTCRYENIRWCQISAKPGKTSERTAVDAVREEGFDVDPMRAAGSGERRLRCLPWCGAPARRRWRRKPRTATRSSSPRRSANRTCSMSASRCSRCRRTTLAEQRIEQLRDLERGAAERLDQGTNPGRDPGHRHPRRRPRRFQLHQQSGGRHLCRRSAALVARADELRFLRP